jgi:hypothetical protein
MHLGDDANFKWDPVKKRLFINYRYIFEGEEEQAEE